MVEDLTTNGLTAEDSLSKGGTCDSVNIICWPSGEFVEIGEVGDDDWEGIQEGADGMTVACGKAGEKISYSMGRELVLWWQTKALVLQNFHEKGICFDEIEHLYW